jgi:transposase
MLKYGKQKINKLEIKNGNMSKKFIEIDRSESIVLPCDFEGLLDENDLSRFIVEIVEQLDTSELENEYKGRGNAAFSPKIMLALFFWFPRAGAPTHSGRASV